MNHTIATERIWIFGTDIHFRRPQELFIPENCRITVGYLVFYKAITIQIHLVKDKNVYSLTMCIINEAKTTIHPQPPSGGGARLSEPSLDDSTFSASPFFVFTPPCDILSLCHSRLSGQYRLYNIDKIATVW